MNYGRIVSDPGFLDGEAYFGGTVIAVSAALRALARNGGAYSPVLEAYPALTSDDLTAALEYSAYIVSYASHIDREEHDPDQAWFWSTGWQARHREAMDDVTAGRVKTYDTMDDMLSDLMDDDQE